MTQKLSIGSLQFAVEKRGQGPVLLLVHGFPLDHTMWLGQLEGLSDQLTVVAPDLRGFGNSDITAGTVTMERYAMDLVALLDELEIEGPIYLCGLSMGGYIAWQFVQRYSHRVQRLILCDTRAAADNKEARDNRLKMADRVTAEGTGFVVDSLLPKLFAAETLNDHPDRVEAVRQTILNTPPAGIAAAQRGMAERPDVTPNLQDIPVATLLLGGEHDQLSPPDEMRSIAAAMPSAEFVAIEGAGHMAPLECPRVVNREIRRFLSL